MIDQAVTELAPLVGVRAGCAAVGETQARWYRRHRQSPLPERSEHVPATQPRALTEVERKEVLRLLHEPDHVDEAPATVYAKLLDDGIYVASVSTMYRILRAEDEVRCRQGAHPARKKPELLATGPNDVWSWDITKLLGPVKWTYYYLYVIIDIYSRYVPGWMLAHAENGRLAETFLADTFTKQHIRHGQLNVHSDNGGPMIAKPVAFLLADLGVTKSHSRPHVSNDNPYSESQFRTMKYRPEFPDRFGSIEDAHTFCTWFFGCTTTSTATQASGSTPPPMSTTDAPNSSKHDALRCSTSPTANIANGSCASHPHHPSSPPSPGSTNHRRTPPRHTDSRRNLPHQG